jgi:hypothetical protein
MTKKGFPMKKSLSRSLLLAATFCLFLGPAIAHAGATQADQTGASEVRREMAETLKAIAGYSAEQRDAAVAKAREALAKIDARIEDLQQQLDQNLQPMSEEARKQARESLQALRKQRTEIAEWYGGLKHSSAGAWNEIKKGFAQSYSELEKALEKAREKF